MLNQHWPKLSRARGFTLLELLITVGVIAILAAMLLPGLSRAKTSARLAVCKSNLRQIGIGLNLYVNDFRAYPLDSDTDNGNGIFIYDEQVWSSILLPYCGGPGTPMDPKLGRIGGTSEIQFCPADRF